MESNELWLNVKGNYIFYNGKIIFNSNLTLNLKCYNNTEFWLFLKHLKQCAVLEKVGE